MASTYKCPDGDASSICLTDLAHHILHSIFTYLDEQSLCKAAQTCTVFLRLAGSADLWKSRFLPPEDKLMLAAKLCLSRALHIPPQMFNLSDDLARSTKFPITAYFTNLRGVLGVPYNGSVVHPRLDEAIATACSGIEAQIKRARQAKQDILQCATASTPAALFVLVRPERMNLRFELRQKPALIAILHGLEELGWPIHLEESALASLQSRPRGSARSQLLLVRHLLGPYSKQVPGGPEYATVVGVLRNLNIAELYWRLREGAQCCIKAAGLQGKHPSVLEDWLGATEALAQHATSRDMELVLQLRQFFPDWLPMSRERGPSSGLHGHASTAQSAIAALKRHCTLGMANLLIYEPRTVPNGLVELAACLRREGACVSSAHGEAPEESVRSNRPTYGGTAGHRAAEHKDAGPVGRQADAKLESEHGALGDHISRELYGSDPTVVARLRLKARLHLEVLRVMSWCFFMLGTEHEQRTTNAKRKPTA